MTDLAHFLHVKAGLLPVLRRTLGLPRLDYVSVQNQGDYLIEVPADRTDVPKVPILTPPQHLYQTGHGFYTHAACTTGNW